MWLSFSLILRSSAVLHALGYAASWSVWWFPVEDLVYNVVFTVGECEEGRNHVACGFDACLS